MGVCVCVCDNDDNIALPPRLEIRGLACMHACMHTAANAAGRQGQVCVCVCVCVCVIMTTT